MRTLFLAVVAAHGLAHVVGFLEGWHLNTVRGMPYQTTILAGHMDVGVSGMRVLGTLWLFVAIGFEAAAIGGLVHASWWGLLTAALATLSLALCLMQLPEARIGAVIDVLILVTLAVGQYLAWGRTIV